MPLRTCAIASWTAVTRRKGVIRIPAEGVGHGCEVDREDGAGKHVEPLCGVHTPTSSVPGGA